MVKSVEFAKKNGLYVSVNGEDASRADKEFLKSQIENLKESAHERFATVLMQIDYLNLKLFRAEKGCKKLREENRRLRAENQMLEDNMGNLLCTREEEMRYNRVLNENITKLAEVNALMAGKLSVYEPIKKAESQPDETADTVRESDPAEE